MPKTKILSAVFKEESSSGVALKNKTLKKISMINTRQKKFDNDFRKAQTRTKIQLGGLLMKSGLTDFFNINSGDDLQLDSDKKDQAYILLGILSGW